MQGWELVCWGGFQDIDLLRWSQRFGFIDFPRCTKISNIDLRIPNYPNTEHIQYFSHLFHNYWDLLRLQDFPKCFRISKIISRFHNVDFRFSTIVNPFFLSPQQFNFRCLTRPFPNFQNVWCQKTLRFMQTNNAFEKCSHMFPRTFKVTWYIQIHK